MKIAVFGATGQAGSRIVAEAARRGHLVTALSRRAPVTPIAGATWQATDATDADAVARVAAEHDVVVAAHGPSRVPGENPADFVGEFDAFAHAVAPTRLAVIGGAGSLYAAPGVRLVDTPDFPEIYKAEALAHAAVLVGLKASSATNWTYLSPAPVLEPGERTGTYVVGDESPVGGSISFSDLAVALLDELESPAHIDKRFTVATG